MQTGKKKKNKKNGKSIEKIMQSVSLRSFTALNPESGRSTARLWRPGRGSSSYRYGCRCRPTPGRVVACFSMDKSQSEDSQSSSSSSSTSSSSSSSSSSLSRTQTYALLKQQLAVAAKSENYEEAARIRDSLRTFEDKEPVLRLRRLLNKAIHDENFEDAARYRDELKLVSPHSLLKCSSDATTLGIRVQVRSVYIESRSQPSKGQYFFAYRIRITNNSDRPVQLLRRHWVITDANGKTENIWGVGVIGEQPVILPRTGFEYSSACPLTTSSGRMEGDFEMKHVDLIGSSTFNVTISPFSLSIIGDDSDAI